MREDRKPRTLTEADCLLMVNDFLRQGALRFSSSADGTYLAPAGKESIPPLVDLPKLLAASDRLHDEPDTFDDLKWLLVPGSSLGGARPKASVMDDDALYMAKFPSKSDDWQVITWEAATLDMARRCGISIPDFRLLKVEDRDVLLLRRFDRTPDGLRIHFLSAMSMLGAADNDRQTQRRYSVR